jgi:sodium/bile acid cotransporter 7
MVLRALKRNWFLLGILAALLLGFFFPSAGIALNPGSVTRDVLIVLLFLISGLTLPSESIGRGLKDVRLHLYIQGFIFVAVPAVVLLTTLPLRRAFPAEALIGIFALACLPTTVSSCIVFTQVSGGNVTAAILNASLSNLAGIFLSPLLLSLFLQRAGQPLPPGAAVKILRDLGLMMLAPIAAGQGLRLFLRSFADRHKRRLSVVSNLCILAVLFFAFSVTASNPRFLGNLRGMLWPFLYLGGLHLLLLFLAYAGARALRFPAENRITTLYVAPQKTLAVGVPLLSTYFAYDPALLGVALLPLLFYHPWQLLVAGLVRSSPLVTAHQGTAHQGTAHRGSS